MNDSHRFTTRLAPLGAAMMLLILLALTLGTANRSHAQTRVAINIDGGSGKLHPVVIELDEKNAPQTSANFKKLAAEGFYKGIAFHRVVPNYIVQIGDPLTKDAGKKADWGTGGPGYTVPAELGQKHVRGAVAMARLSDGVNPSRASSGSQFYVCLVDIPALDGDYTVFGKVVSGLEHLERISLVAADTNNNPVSRIAVTGTRVEGDPNAGIASTVIGAGADAAADKPATGLGAKLAERMGKSDPVPADPATATTAGVDTSIIPAPAVASAAPPMPTPAPAAAPAAAPAPAPTPAPAAMPAAADTEFSSQVAAAQAAAAATEAREAAEATASMPTRRPAPAAPVAATPVAARPDQEVSADLTQPSLADNMARDRPAGAPSEPKKKEGFFTRMIKKVW